MNDINIKQLYISNGYGVNHSLNPYNFHEFMESQSDFKKYEGGGL
jgi:hypothetical protein